MYEANKNNFIQNLMMLSRKYSLHLCKVISDAAKLEEEGFTNIPEELDKYYYTSNNNKHGEINE